VKNSLKLGALCIFKTSMLVGWCRETTQKASLFKRTRSPAWSRGLGIQSTFAVLAPSSGYGHSPLITWFCFVDSANCGNQTDPLPKNGTF
jgi:hypothetical protein